ncbi:E3 ubiquitin-protein ligase PUB23-like [Typha latifolia]|uniref:E3 ubiquitin-protein ligase PUB23-like n=1 Tax=Typha latifolia TaxID=4733 RepID=UPI003C2D2AA3
MEAESVVEVPPYFLCPISLDTMTDPVTLSTGITYDRGSIERWIFSDGRRVCPVTKQTLTNLTVTPNDNLRRLIQAWCVANTTDRLPTPQPPVDEAQIINLLDEAKTPQCEVISLRKLRAIVVQSDRNKKCVEDAGGVEFLLSIIRRTISTSTKLEEEIYEVLESTTAGDEALKILYSMQLSEQGMRTNIIERNGDFLDMLTIILGRLNYESRLHAIMLLKSSLPVIAPARLADIKSELVKEVVNVIQDRVSSKAMKGALQILVTLSPWGRNRVKAVEAGAIQVLVELLLDEQDKRVCELMLMALDNLCSCSEGRKELVEHAAGIAMVSKKILRFSPMASEMAVRILLSVARFSASPVVLKEMLQVGAVSKLCLVIQMDCGSKVREKAKEILRLHFRVWRNSPCLAAHLQATYLCL